MAYQLSQLVTDVRKRAKDTAFDSDLITDYLNEVQIQVLERSRWPFMEDLDTDTVSAAQTEYQLDDEAELILGLSLTSAAGSLIRPTYVNYPDFFESFDPETAATGSPSYYTIYGNTILFERPLDQAYTVNVKYLKVPDIMSLDTDVPAIPERFKEVLIRGALSRIEEYRDNYDIAALHARKVEELTEDMLMRLIPRQLATPTKSRVTRRAVPNYGYGWQKGL